MSKRIEIVYILPETPLPKVFVDTCEDDPSGIYLKTEDADVCIASLTEDGKLLLLNLADTELADILDLDKNGFIKVTRVK